LKYFVLNFNDAHRYYSVDLVDSLRKATKNKNAEIFQVGSNDYLKFEKSDDFIKDIIDNLNDSDVIVSLGGFSMLNFLGNAGGFRDALFTKIDARTPFLFQFTRIWEQFECDRMNGEDRFISVRMLLDRLMIYPTGTKIFNQDKLDEIRDDYLVKFNPRNLNPGIFTPFDSGSVWLDSPNLLDFGEGNHALLTSESDHYVDSSDCSVYTPDFRRQSSLDLFPAAYFLRLISESGNRRFQSVRLTGLRSPELSVHSKLPGFNALDVGWC
jgi:hypothetical protein